MFTMCCTALVISTLTTAALAGGAHGKPAAPDAAPATESTPEPEGEPVTLAALLVSAVRRSPGLAIAYADHEEAHDRHAAADAIDQWHVIGRLNGQATALDPALVTPSVALSTMSASAAIGVQRSLSTGGDVSATVSAGPVRDVYLAPATRAQALAQQIIQTGTTTAARLELSQPILRGAGASVARAEQTTARLASRALSAQATDEAASLVRDLVIGYWELAYATEALAVDRDGEALARRQLPITRDVVRLGVQPPSALKIAELQLALHREAVMRDQAMVGDQSLAVRRLAGLELAGAPLIPGPPGDPPDDDWREADAIAAARAHGPSIAQHALFARQADVAIGVADDAMRPRLDVKLSGELDGFAAATGDAFDKLTTGQTYTITGGLALQWDIGGAARAASAATRVRRARLDAERAELDHQLAASVISAVRQLAIARDRIAVTELAVQVADDALRAELVAFRGGQTTTVLVFQRQDDVAQARLRHARARIDAIEAGVALDYWTGGLLARHRITVTDRRSAR